MQMFKHFFSKGGIYDPNVNVTYSNLYAEAQSQIVLTSIVGFTDMPPPQQVQIWEVSSLELEAIQGPTHRSLTNQVNAGTNVINVDSANGIAVGAKLYIRGENANGSKYKQFIADVVNAFYPFPGGVVATLSAPLPYDFFQGDRVFVMTPQGNGIHCQPQSAVAGNSELTLQGECLVAGETRSPLQVITYGQDSQLFVAGYWYDEA